MSINSDQIANFVPIIGAAVYRYVLNADTENPLHVQYTLNFFFLIHSLTIAVLFYCRTLILASNDGPTLQIQGSSLSTKQYDLSVLRNSFMLAGISVVFPLFLFWNFGQVLPLCFSAFRAPFNALLSPLFRIYILKRESNATQRPFKGSSGGLSELLNMKKLKKMAKEMQAEAAGNAPAHQVKAATRKALNKRKVVKA
eukprot:c16498_g1_i1.p1 GENE.c16498_g1_i1~~c16498_g1_i1.p1  ORF type:complete len:215 (+),score=63.17 c16498_g1_i1:52-645(+)